MVDAPAYAQSAPGSTLYVLTPAPAAGWAGFWSPQTPSQSSLTLDQAWAAPGGAYLFCATAPTDAQSMADALATLIPALSPTGLLRALWVQDPNGPAANWRTYPLLARQAANQSWSVARAALFSGGGYGLHIAPGSPLTQSGPAQSGVYGLAIGGAGVNFLTPGGGFAATAGSCVIPLTGVGVGAVAATLAIPPTEDDAFRRLGAGLRYCHPTLSARDGVVDRLDMPLVSQGETSLSLYLSFFPGALLEPALSWLSFFPASGQGVAPALPCYLRTVLGYATTLTPLPAQGSFGAARFVFGQSPLWKPDGNHNVDDAAYHLCPDGAFAIATATPPQYQFNDPGGVVDKVLLGASGSEYVGLTALSGCVALFAGGADAYAPSLASPGDQDEDPALLTGQATTSAVTFLPPLGKDGALTYFAQPRQSPLYRAGDSGFLDFLELPAARLATDRANLALGVYAGIDDDRIQAARLLDQGVLAPARNQAAMKSPAQRSTGADAAGAKSAGTPVQGVTPPGLCVTVSDDLTTWRSILLAQMPDMDPPGRAFSSVSKDLQSAMQADQLFFVVADPAVLAPPPELCPQGACTSVAYRLDSKSLDILAEAGVDPATIAALRSGLKPLGYPTYQTKNQFLAAVLGFAPSVSDADKAKILAIAGQLSLEIDHWSFQLSPDSWRRASDSPTLMLVKYANSTLEELVGDASRWGYAAAAGDKSATQRLIQSIFDAARQAALEPGASPYADFYRDVVSNPAWNGFLFLNAPVNVAELPTELLFLTAGIDLARFYAHHVAIGATPYKSENGVLTQGPSSISGLIDYSDSSDLVMEATVPYAFKTQQLTAVFNNTALVDFKAQCELMVNRLFDAETTKVETEHGNNLVLKGGYQRQNGEPVYTFILTGLNDYSLQRSALASVSVSAVQIQTADSNQTHITVSFLLAGKMRFFELPLFDLFSYGAPQTAGDETPADADSALAFSNLAVLMQFDLGDPTKQTFIASPNNMAFDLANSLARTASLAKRFPIKLTGLALGTQSSAGPGAPSTTPEDLGYSGVSAPLDASLMTAPWYGLVFSLDMGTLGALSGGKPLVMSLMAGWRVGAADNQRPVYLGLKMPDARPLGIDWPLQGVLHLGFRSFDFVASGEGDKRAYMLRMRRFGLSALGVSFPPGNLDIFMFGDPNGGDAGKLGWYAAYAPDAKDKQAPAPRAANARLAEQAQPRLSRSARALRNGRRPRAPHTGL